MLYDEQVISPGNQFDAGFYFGNTTACILWKFNRREKKELTVKKNNNKNNNLKITHVYIIANKYCQKWNWKMYLFHATGRD